MELWYKTVLEVQRQCRGIACLVRQDCVNTMQVEISVSDNLIFILNTSSFVLCILRTKKKAYEELCWYVLQKSLKNNIVSTRTCNYL